MNKKIMLTVAAVGIFFLIGNLSAEEAVKPQPATDKKVQTVCPVQGEAIDKSLFVDYQGKRIYVCCAECIEKVKADPAKYVKELEAKGIALEATPKDKTSAETPKTEKKAADHQH